jgi:cyclohexadienyl dehydratase
MHLHRSSLKTPSLLALALLLGAAAACHSSPAPAPPRTELRVGTSGDYPPFSEWKAERPQGFSVAVVESFAEAYRLEPSWVRFRWPDMVKDLEAGKFDLVDSEVTVRPERSLTGRFTVPVLRHGAVLLLRRPSWAPPASASPPSFTEALAQVRALDRPELRVAVNRGGHLERVARSLFHQAQVLAIPDNAVRQALATGQADAALSNTIEAPRWAQGLTGIELLGPLTRDVVALYVRADRPDLEARLNAWLLGQERSGALGSLRARYLGPGAGDATALPVQALLAATAERLALMPWVAAAKQREGKPIEDLPQEAKVLAASRQAVRSAAGAMDRALPPDEALDAFFQAQIDAAKGVQRRASFEAGASSPSLDQELRPAIARISDRMAWLVARLPEDMDEATVLALAQDWLGSSGLEAAELERIARTLAALRPGPGSGVSQAPKPIRSGPDRDVLPRVWDTHSAHE